MKTKKMEFDRTGAVRQIGALVPVELFKLLKVYCFANRISLGDFITNLMEYEGFDLIDISKKIIVRFADDYIKKEEKKGTTIDFYVAKKYAELLTMKRFPANICEDVKKGLIKQLTEWKDKQNQAI